MYNAIEGLGVAAGQKVKMGHEGAEIVVGTSGKASFSNGGSNLSAPTRIEVGITHDPEGGLELKGAARGANQRADFFR